MQWIGQTKSFGLENENDNYDDGYDGDYDGYGDDDDDNDDDDDGYGEECIRLEVASNLGDKWSADRTNRWRPSQSRVIITASLAHNSASTSCLLSH